ncbi:MAG TPA: thioredoxin fold domain-containing protein [Burkholderiales bacterium]|nr:thioredoxin fold domain-containing protein [Burkholderiales bacterium]
MRLYAALALAVALVATPVRAADPPARAQARADQAAEIPGWFKESFLDFPDELREAAAAKKRLLLYFGQDGCPYCRELMQVNFGRKDIADTTRARFDAIALNIWGDREVTWTDGRKRTEKEFASLLKVQFTPTVLFLDERGEVVLRLNGYYPPHKFAAALDFASGRSPAGVPFPEYLRQAAAEPASGRLHDEPFLAKPPFDLKRLREGSRKPLAVLFEQKECAPCDELHGKGFKDAAAAKLVPEFQWVRLDLFGRAPLTTPDGKASTESDWGRALGVAYTPTTVFFDAGGKEVFRIEAYLKPFHLASSLEYVASGAYRGEPNFQRFIQARAQRLREKGQAVQIWQ